MLPGQGRLEQIFGFLFFCLDLAWLAFTESIHVLLGLTVIVKSNGDEAWQKVKCPTSITTKKRKEEKSAGCV